MLPFVILFFQKPQIPDQTTFQGNAELRAKLS